MRKLLKLLFPKRFPHVVEISPGVWFIRKKFFMYGYKYLDNGDFSPGYWWLEPNPGYCDFEDYETAKRIADNL